MNKTFTTIIALVVSTLAFGQQYDDQYGRTERKLTKYEQIESKTGSIIKFQDVNMPILYQTGLSGVGLKPRIRLLMGESDSFFYVLEKPGSSSSARYVAAIAYTDLIEINRALKTLSASFDGDVAAKPEYLENKFRTEDDLEVGYYISSIYPKGTWFVKLSWRSDSIVYIKQADLIKSFNEAQSKIEELMAKRD